MNTTSAAPLVSINEAAEVLAVNHMTVRRMIWRGELPAYRIGKSRAIRIKTSDIEKMLRPIEPQQEGI